MTEQINNPLHGLTLEAILTQLVEHYGWDGLGQRIDIRCFTVDPSIKSSLKFLRKTQWARDKVEGLYVATFADRKAAKAFKQKTKMTKDRTDKDRADNNRAKKPAPRKTLEKKDQATQNKSIWNKPS